MPLSDAAAREIANVLREARRRAADDLIGDHQGVYHLQIRFMPGRLISRSRQKALADWHAVRARSK